MKKTKEQIIKECQAIAEKNYSKGYDAICECWDEGDWENLYVEFKGSLPKMKKDMKLHAECWIEQNLNTRWGEDDDSCLSMLD